jgi:hypothetical protein
MKVLRGYRGHPAVGARRRRRISSRGAAATDSASDVGSGTTSQVPPWAVEGISLPARLANERNRGSKETVPGRRRGTGTTRPP